MAVSILSARVLGPEIVGGIGILNLWLLYAGLVRTGTLDAAVRDIPHLTGVGNDESAQRVQNVAFTYEGLLTFLCFLVLLAASRFYSTPWLASGMLVIAFSSVIGMTNIVVTNISYARQRFKVIVRANYLSRLLGPLTVLATLYWLGLYAVLLGPIVAGLASLAVLLWPGQGTRLRFSICWDRQEALRLAKSGVPIAIAGLAYWALLTIDRTVLAASWPLETTGHYIFASSMVVVLLGLLADFGRVLGPILQQEIAQAGSVSAVGGEGKSLAILIVCAASITVNFAQAGFAPFVSTVLPRFVASVPVFETLSFLVIAVSATIVPSSILYSVAANRQRQSMLIWGGGLLIGGALVSGVLFLGGNSVAVAGAMVVTLAFVAIAHYIALQRFWFVQTGDAVLFWLWMVGIALFSGLVWQALYSPIGYQGKNEVLAMVWRLSIVGFSWGAVALLYLIVTHKVREVLGVLHRALQRMC